MIILIKLQWNLHSLQKAISIYNIEFRYLAVIKSSIFKKMGGIHTMLLSNKRGKECHSVCSHQKRSLFSAKNFFDLLNDEHSVSSFIINATDCFVSLLYTPFIWYGKETSNIGRRTNGTYSETHFTKTFKCILFKISLTILHLWMI